MHTRLVRINGVRRLWCVTIFCLLTLFWHAAYSKCSAGWLPIYFDGTKNLGGTSEATQNTVLSDACKIATGGSAQSESCRTTAPSTDNVYCLYKGRTALTPTASGLSKIKNNLIDVGATYCGYQIECASGPVSGGKLSSVGTHIYFLVRDYSGSVGSKLTYTNWGGCTYMQDGNANNMQIRIGCNGGTGVFNETSVINESDKMTMNDFKESKAWCSAHGGGQGC